MEPSDEDRKSIVDRSKELAASNEESIAHDLKALEKLPGKKSKKLGRLKSVKKTRLN